MSILVNDKSYVQSFATYADFPIVGKFDIIYVDESINAIYRWTGSAYEEIGQYPQVETYADLPPAADNTGKIYFVKTTTGIWGINQKPAGFYFSDGATWTQAPMTAGALTTADVIDNLTSTTTNKPLSANQGYVLKGLIDTINNEFEERVDDEVNALIQDGNHLQWTYDDLAGTLTGDVVLGTLGEIVADLNTGSASQFINGQGNLAIPSGIVSTYTAVSFSAQTSVTVNHNFAAYPVVQIILSDNTLALAPITHTSINSFTVTFPSAQTGTVIATIGSDQAPSYIAVSSNYTTTSEYNIIQATTAGITITVESAVGKTGLEKTINNSSSGDITLLPTGLELLGIYSSITLSTQDSISLYSDGTNWRIF